MKFKPFLIVCLVILALAGLIWQNSFVDAATENPSTGSSGYQIINIGPFSSTSATTLGIWTMKAPWPFRVIGFTGYSTAVSNVTTFDLKNAAGVSLLSTAITPSTTAGVVTAATLTTGSSTLNVTDETVLQVDTGTLGNGTTTHTTLQLIIKRL